MTYSGRHIQRGASGLREGTVRLQDRVAETADTSGVAIRTPSAETLARYRSDPAYTYETESSGLGWWDRFWRWLFEQVEPVSSVPWMDEVIYGIGALIVTAILVGAVRWMLRMRVTPPMEARSGTEGTPTVTRAEMETVDFVKRAEEAAAKGNYPEAVRHQYLAILQHLMQADLIHWTPDKANRTLVRETRTHPVHASFAQATDVFEEVRYGGLSVDAETYDEIRAMMETVRESPQAPTSST